MALRNPRAKSLGAPRTQGPQEQPHRLTKQAQPGECGDAVAHRRGWSSSRCFPVRMPNAWMIRSVVSWKASRPPSCCIQAKLGSCARVFWGRWVSSMSSRRAWCQSRLNSSCSRASSSVRLEHLFEEVDPEDGLHRPVGDGRVVHAVHGTQSAPRQSGGAPRFGKPRPNFSPGA